MRRDWHGLAALILALGVTVSLVIIAAAKLIYDGHGLTDEEAGLFATVLGAAVGALATYLGGHDWPPSNRREPNMTTETPTPPAPEPPTELPPEEPVPDEGGGDEDVPGHEIPEPPPEPPAVFACCR
jgi:hypothetical protein